MQLSALCATDLPDASSIRPCPQRPVGARTSPVSGKGFGAMAAATTGSSCSSVCAAIARAYRKSDAKFTISSVPSSRANSPTWRLMPATSGSENDSCQKKVALLRVVLTTRTFCRALTAALALAGRRQAGRLLGLRHGRHVGERLLAEALGHRVVLLV